METSPTKSITMEKLSTEMKRVIKSQKHVFVQLSFLSLLPLSIATVLFLTLKPIIIPKESNPNDETALFSTINILLALGAYLVTLILYINAIASITFTAFPGFNDQQIKLKPAIKSISASFFPLLATLLLSHAITFILAFLFILFIGALTQLGFASLTASKFFLVVLAAVFIAITVYFQVNWLLSYPVVVVESKWGFKALKRSKTLINGNKWIALRVIIGYGALYLMILWTIGTLTGSTSGTFSVDTSYLILKALLILASMFLLIRAQLYGVVAPTVLYALCKESQTDEYFSLPVNDHIVASVV